MKKAVLFLLCVAVISCAGTSRKTVEKWEVSNINHTIEYFTNHTEIEFAPNSIVFTNKNTRNTFEYILIEQRLVIKTQPEKLLFEIQKISATEWKLTEMYANNPAIITIKKINH
jgi:hypothetical protein